MSHTREANIIAHKRTRIFLKSLYHQNTAMLMLGLNSNVVIVSIKNESYKKPTFQVNLASASARIVVTCHMRVSTGITFTVGPATAFAQ